MFIFEIIPEVIFQIHKCSCSKIYHYQSSELYEYVIIINTNTVHHHTTMMIILNTTAITHRTMMHSRHLICFTYFTKSKLTIIFHFIIYHIRWLKCIVEKKRVERICKFTCSFRSIIICLKFTASS